VQIRSHKIAQITYELVAKRKQPEDLAKLYGALAHKFPSMVLQSGLAQSTGFLLAKNKEQHIAVFDDIRAVFNSLGNNFISNESLHETVIASNLVETMELTRQTLEITSYLKRYVQGVLRISSTGDSLDEEDLNSEGNQQ